MALKLMGARYFLEMPSGTIYQRFWADNDQELLTVISDFNNNKLKIDWDCIEIYGDNYGSMSIEYDEDRDDYIYYYDANVVGDANPFDTLYLVIEEDVLPNNVKINGKVFTKSEILGLRQSFLKILEEENYNRTYDPNEWAREYLEEPKCKENYFINLKLEK